jgi:hypothetical protein
MVAFLSMMLKRREEGHLQLAAAVTASLPQELTFQSEMQNR